MRLGRWEARPGAMNNLLAGDYKHMVLFNMMRKGKWIRRMEEKGGFLNSNFFEMCALFKIHHAHHERC